MSRRGVEDLPERLREIASWDHAACTEAWRRAFGQPTPKRLRPPMLRRILAYDVQARSLGDLSPSETRTLRSVARGTPVGDATKSVTPGTQLVREWNGRAYRVEVKENGYVLDGTTFSSLSAVAKRITGTSWSGPRFFGLAGKRSA